jgi:hypothetical protein
MDGNSTRGQFGIDNFSKGWSPVTTVGGRLCCLALALFLLGTCFGTPSYAQEPVVIEISLSEARRNFGTVRVHRGDEVTLRLIVEDAIEFHLHGYNVTARSRPGEPAELKFAAEVLGRFAVEAHTPTGHRNYGYVEVHPR